MSEMPQIAPTLKQLLAYLCKVAIGFVATFFGPAYIYMVVSYDWAGGMILIGSWVSLAVGMVVGLFSWKGIARYALFCLLCFFLIWPITWIVVHFRE